VPLLDGLGSPVGLVGSTGTIATGYQYDSFGAPTQSGSSNSFPYLFAGREWSDPLNLMQLYYNSARKYSPGLHRFISRDPLGSAGSGANLYAYVGDDPVNATDPTGLFGFSISFGFGGNSESASAPPDGCSSWLCFAGNFSTADYDPPENKPKPIFQPSSGCLHSLLTLNNSYTRSTPCAYTADEVMAAVESDFADFADLATSVDPGLQVSATFSPPPTGLQKGSVMPVGGSGGPISQSSSITVESADTQTMTFRTAKDHPFYPAHITFAASQSGPGVVTFDITAKGRIAMYFKYYGGGFIIEDAIWEHFLDKVVELCTGGG
jgi:RHS repeat-associated protein